jgi:hypothetical protein
MSKKNKQSSGNNTKQSPQKQKQKAVKLVVAPPSVQKVRKPATFGPVSTITTAPVAIGNSVRGASKRIVKTSNGVRVSGRDFMFSPSGTGTIITWSMCGGTPLTPAAFADSVISNYQRMYMKFKFHSIVVHYITSSPTSANGDVMFYYSKDRSSVFLNQTSSQLLPFVFTDQNTVLGPQWTNHSAKFNVSGGWKLTDYGMHDGVEEYADGEMFLLSKTSTADSPGYVIFDYDIEFAQESFQPRLLSFPIPRIQWYQTNLTLTAVNAAQDATVVFLTSGNNNSGAASTWPPGHGYGDIYKVIFDVTNSSASAWTAGATTANLLESFINGTRNAITIADGFTCYGVHTNTNLELFLNCTAAYTQSNALAYGLSLNPLTANIQVWLSYVGTLEEIGNLPNF